MRTVMRNIVVIVMVAASFAFGGVAFKLFSNKQPPQNSEQSIFYQALAPLYATVPGHADLIMLGDSITWLADWNALLPGISVANRGIPGDTTRGVLSRLDAVLAIHAKCAALLIGVNDVLSGVPTDLIAANYAAIVSRLRESGIFPIAEGYAPPTGEFSKLDSGVRALNQTAKELCGLGRCIYLDALANDTAPSTIDGIHLLPQTYLIWAGALRPITQSKCR
jgi:hypothetical protein